MTAASTRINRDGMPAWGEREERRFAFRVGLFQRRGLSQADAETWADRLYERDLERDDRRLCWECKNLQKTGGCVAASQGRIHGADRRLHPIRDILQRCEEFEWLTP